MIKTFWEGCKDCPLKGAEGWLHSRYFTVIGFFVSVAMIYGVLFFSDRYFHNQAQHHFEIHASEHFRLFGEKIRKNSRDIAQVAESINVYKDDLYVEIHDDRGTFVFRTFRPYDNRSQYRAERILRIGEKNYHIHYDSTPLYDVNHSGRFPILYAVAGVIVHLFLLYIIVELLRSRALVKSKAAELESSRAWLDTILKSSVDGVHILDEQGKLIACSPSVLGLTGYSVSEPHNLVVYDEEA